MTAGPVLAWTRFPVGLEEGPNGWTTVHAFTLPGCAASGPTKEDALDAFAATLGDWLGFLAAAGEPVPSPESELEIAVEEWVLTDVDVAGGESSACFVADRHPLDDPAILSGLHTLGSLRGRLLPHVRRAKDEDLESLGPPDGNVRLVLDELARAQWWILTRLGASPLAEVPDRVVARLDTAMALTIQTLGHLPGDRRDTVIEMEGEEWTPKKVMRRLLWLEWTVGGAALHTLQARTPGSG